MGLLQLGEVKLASGLKSEFKIECDALDVYDWEAAASMLAKAVPQPFSDVYGVPTGGHRLAEFLWQYAVELDRPVTLLADDVYTTGGSMRKYMYQLGLNPKKGDRVMGAVLFARGAVPEHVTALFTIHPHWQGK